MMQWEMQGALEAQMENLEKPDPACESSEPSILEPEDVKFKSRLHWLSACAAGRVPQTLCALVFFIF